jgi:hypothetical protein
MTDPDFLQLPPMTVLETARLRMRTVRVSDAVSIMPIITDKTTMMFTSGVVANDREVAERWLSARALGKDVLNFVITLKNGEEGDEVEGNGEEVVGIMGSYHWPEVGYLMHPGEFWYSQLVNCPIKWTVLLSLIPTINAQDTNHNPSQPTQAKATPPKPSAHFSNATSPAYLHLLLQQQQQQQQHQPPP